MNPYEVLDVPTDADDEAIKKAYRNRSRETHPDRGGEGKEFKKVNHAYLILSDPKKRASYDRTGDVDENEPDNHTREIMNIFGIAIAGVMGGLGGANPTHRDFVKLMSDGLVNRQNVLVEMRKKVDKQIEDLALLVGRFKTEESENLIEQVVTGTLNHSKRVVKNMETEQQYTDEAIGLLAKYTFEIDQPNVQEYSAEALLENLFGTQVAAAMRREPKKNPGVVGGYGYEPYAPYDEHNIDDDRWP